MIINPNHQVASLITLVFPVAARASVNLALAARIILGWLKKFITEKWKFNLETFFLDQFFLLKIAFNLNFKESS